MRYSTILFDLDHTLYDADTAADIAFETTLASVGVLPTPELLDAFVEINVDLWGKVEQGVLTPNEVRSLRFAQLIERGGFAADPEAMGDAYVVGLGSNGELYDGALAMLAEVAMDGTLALVTNGIGEVQRMRVARTDIGQFFDAIVISGEVGVAKPGSEIFDITFEQLGHPDKASTLIVGDSLSSDMRGGIDYGIATCLYAPNGSPETDLPITHRITDLAEIPDIVAGRS